MSVTDAYRRPVLGLLSPAGPRARLLILTFHQVPREPDSLAPDTADVGLFTDQMRWLSEFCKVLPLPEAADRLRDGRLPARAACITFDDGYADNCEIAAPVLRKLGLTATFFITAGAVETGIMWNDLVIEGIRRASADLDLTDLGLGVLPVSDDVTRRATKRAVIGQLKYRPLDERLALAEAIYSRAAGGTAPRLMMTSDQVADLARQGFDIGAHTISHPILKELSSEHAQREIERSRDWVCNVTGFAPRSFAYPNGRPGIDFSTEHEQMTEAAGFTVAVSTRWGCATHRDSIFALPRFLPWGQDRGKYWQRLAKTLARSYAGGG